jgi:RNA polymerase sigma factor (sigma-70 family)
MRYFPLFCTIHSERPFQRKTGGVNLKLLPLETVAHNWADSIFRIAFHYTKSPEDADDIVQNVLLKYYKSKRQFESSKEIQYWLIRVTINESKQFLRSPWKKVTSLEEYAERLSLEQPGQSDLFCAVMELKKPYRIVIYLYYYEGYSVKEIAKILHKNPSTIQTHLMRAREKLKIKLKEV